MSFYRPVLCLALVFSISVFGVDLTYAGSCEDREFCGCSFDELMPLAAKGDANAQYKLGMLLFEGKGGASKNYNSAAQYFRQSGDKGIVGAVAMYAHMADEGKGLDKNKPLALKLYRSLASKGYFEGQLYLGLWYSQENTRQFDHESAIKWFRLAALQLLEEGPFIGKYAIDRSKCF